MTPVPYVAETVNVSPIPAVTVAGLRAVSAKPPAVVVTLFVSGVALTQYRPAVERTR